MKEKFIQEDGTTMLRNISVIIRCRNEEQWIGHAIQSVCDSIDNPEIIIVDNNSTDESMDVVRMFDKWHNVVELNIDDYSPGRSLNLGFQKASHAVVLVLSAHCVLRAINDNHIDLLNEHRAVFGKQIPIYRGRRINTRYIWDNFVDEQVVNMWSENENRHFLHNALCLYRRDFVLSCPFDEDLYGKEDRYWAKDIVDQGNTFCYEPSLLCEHHWTPNGATWKGIG